METYDLVDRTGWPPGPWDGEPDLVTWRIAICGNLACRAQRTPEVGTWCGYVEVPREHPWFGIEDYDSLPVEVIHGGLTFAGEMGETWWIGFDCAHFMDVMPGIIALHSDFNEPIARYEAMIGSTYKDLHFVRGGCAVLALQVYRAGI